MKYLKKSNREPALELVDLMDLQTDLLEDALRKNSIRDIGSLNESVELFVLKVFNLSQTDFEKFRKVLDSITHEYLKQYDYKIDTNTGYPIILLANPLIRRIIGFYMKGVKTGFVQSDIEIFSYFFGGLERIFNLTTSKESNDLPPKVNFFGTLSPQQPKLEQLYSEILGLIDELFPLMDENSKTTRWQSNMKEQLVFHLHTIYYFSDDYELKLSTKTVHTIEETLWSKIVETDDLDAFIEGCKGLHGYADIQKYQFQEIKLKIDQDIELSKLLRLAAEIVTLNDYFTLLKVCDEIEGQNSLVEDIKKLASYSYKLSLLRFTFIRIGAKLIVSWEDNQDKGREKWVYWLLFNRQPLFSGYTSANSDFFSTDLIVLQKYVARIDELERSSYMRLDSLKYKPFIDRFILLWLFRNYLWSKNTWGNDSISFGNLDTGFEVNQLKNLIDRVLLISNDNLPLVFEGKEYIDDFVLFSEKLKTAIDELIKRQQSKILNAPLEEQKKKNFEQAVLSKIADKGSLLGLLMKNIPYEFKESGNVENIENIEFLDKTPFISDDLPLVKSINAISAYSEVCAQNTIIKSDLFIARKLEVQCEKKTLTISEMDHILETSSFSGKLILSHYVFLGYEILKERMNRNNRLSDGKEYFEDGMKKDIAIHRLARFSDRKFIFVLDEKYLDELVKASSAEIEIKDNEHNPLEIEVKTKRNIEVAEIGKELGTLYFLI